MQRVRLSKLKPSSGIVWLSAVIAVSAGLLLYRLYGLTPGLAPAETALPTARASLSALWNQPLEAPLLLSQLLVAALWPTTGAALSRLPSVLLGLALVACAFWLLRRWYGQRLALFGMALLITAPWLLHAARLATTDIVYPFAMVLILVLAALWHQPQWRLRSLYLSALAVATLLYVPGAILLLTAVALLERKTIYAQLRRRKKHTAAAVILGLAGLVPLIHAAVIQPDILLRLAGIPAALPQVDSLVRQIGLVWPNIFIGGQGDPLRNLGALPVSSAFVSLTFVIGVYLYVQHRKATRAKQLLALWLLGTLLVGLGTARLTLLLPIVHVLSVGGIGYLLHMWLKTFPRNPYARTFGIGLLAVVICFAVAYNLRHYYQAWPNTPAVRSVFTRQL